MSKGGPMGTLILFRPTIRCKSCWLNIETMLLLNIFTKIKIKFFKGIRVPLFDYCWNFFFQLDGFNEVDFVIFGLNLRCERY